MSENQLNFKHIFDEAIAADQAEQAKKVREKEDRQAGLAPIEVREYWQNIAADEALTGKRQAIIQTDNDLPLINFTPFMIEINWYIKRMANFRLLFEQAANGQAKEQAYGVLVNPDFVDKQYSDTAKLFIKYNEAYQKQLYKERQEAYKLKLEQEKQQKREAKKTADAAKAKEKRKQKKEASAGNSESTNIDQITKEKNKSSYNDYWADKSGKWKASGE